MTSILSYRRSILLAGVLGLLMTAGPAVAQAPPGFSPLDKTKPAESKQDTNLKPHPTPPTVTALDKLPVDKLKLPNGFKAEVWSHGHPGARTMVKGDKGTIFMGTRLIGRVYAITDKDGKREVKTLLTGLTQPNGLEFKDGALYVFAINKVFRYDNIEDKLDNPGDPVELTEKFNLPDTVHHNWKYVAFGPDGKLYVQVGANCNICEINNGIHGQIRRYNADGSGMEIVARGVRNTVGFDWHPETRELWFTDNGRDWLTNNQPEEELNRVTKTGLHFGFPVCHAGTVIDPEFGKGKSCEDYERPVALLGPHAAALGMRFYTGNMLPPEYKNRIFVARHGSWNRERKEGYDVLQVTPQEKGAALVEMFAHGWLEGDNFWGRPVDVQVMRDGALLVSDDWNGAIYRIAHKH